MSTKKQAESGEDRLIARYFAPIAKHPGACGLTDDAAAIAPPPGCDLVLTADGIVGGVHFLPDDPPEAVARKALRVNLSDLAAKGAEPIGFLLTLALPKEVGDAWLTSFARGLGADADVFGCPLLGGDTVRTPGPKPGDRVVVTGTIGDAALGLLLRRDAAAAERWGLTRDQRDHLAARYLVPEPRSAIAAFLGSYATAAMDVSDGLAGDLAKLCRVSGVAAEIAVARVPLSDAARIAVAKEPALIETVIAGGDDYEVLACVPAEKVEALRRQASAAGVAVTEIGTVKAGEGEARFLGADGKPLVLAQTSYSHF